MTRANALERLRLMIEAQIEEGHGLAPMAAEHARELAAYLEQPERARARSTGGDRRKRAREALSRWRAEWPGYPEIPGWRKTVEKEAQELAPEEFEARMQARILESRALVREQREWLADKRARHAGLGFPDPAPVRLIRAA